MDWSDVDFLVWPSDVIRFDIEIVVHDFIIDQIAKIEGELIGSLSIPGVMLTRSNGDFDPVNHLQRVIQWSLIVGDVVKLHEKLNWYDPEA